MKTAVSVPDRVFAAADKLARRLGKTRSQLYTEALAEYVARRDADTVTEALDRVYDREGSRLDAPFAAASRTVLERSEW